MCRCGPQNCPWTSSKKRKKRRKTETITMSEETKPGLADSDKGSYYEQYFSQGLEGVLRDPGLSGNRVRDSGIQNKSSRDW